MVNTAEDTNSTVTPNSTPTPATRTRTLACSAASTLILEGSPPAGGHGVNRLSHVRTATVPQRMNSDQLRTQLAKCTLLIHNSHHSLTTFI